MNRLRWGWSAWPETALHPLLGQRAATPGAWDISRQLGLHRVPGHGSPPWVAACRAGRRGSLPQRTLAGHQEGRPAVLQTITQLCLSLHHSTSLAACMWQWHWGQQQVALRSDSCTLLWVSLQVTSKSCWRIILVAAHRTRGQAAPA